MNIRSAILISAGALVLGACKTYPPRPVLPYGPQGAQGPRAYGPQQEFQRYGIPQQHSPPPPAPQQSRDTQFPPSPQVEPRAEDPRPSGDYPVARRTENPDEVFSPYPPHHRINVEGFRSGQFAKDPKTNQIFLVP